MTQININSRLVTFAQQELVIINKGPERERITATNEHLFRLLRSGLSPIISDVRTFGSFDRNTILPRHYDPESDIDILVIFKHDNVRTLETYRNKIRSVLEKPYSSALIKKDFPTVRMELDRIIYDFVPCYITGSPDCYFIPDRDSRWRQTDPKEVKKILNSASNSSDPSIVHNTIRLIKYWNVSKNRPFNSFELERDLAKLSYHKYKCLYDSFLGVLEKKAGNYPEVREALQMIQKYKGTQTIPANTEKQFECLKRLLPRLK